MSGPASTAEGQKADLRRAHDGGVGDRMRLVPIEPGRLEVVAPHTPIWKPKGRFGIPLGPVTVAEMNAAIEAQGSPAR